MIEKKDPYLGKLLRNQRYILLLMQISKFNDFLKAVRGVPYRIAPCEKFWGLLPEMKNEKTYLCFSTFKKFVDSGNCGYLLKGKRWIVFPLL